MWTVDGSESVLRAWLHGKLLTFVCTDLVRGPYWPFFILVFFFFSFFSNLKLPIMPFSYFVMQFNIKTLIIFKNVSNLIIRLFYIIVHYMNELALRAVWLLLVRCCPPTYSYWPVPKQRGRRRRRRRQRTIVNTITAR